MKNGFGVQKYKNGSTDPKPFFHNKQQEKTNSKSKEGIKRRGKTDDKQRLVSKKPQKYCCFGLLGLKRHQHGQGGGHHPKKKKKKNGTPRPREFWVPKCVKKGFGSKKKPGKPPRNHPNPQTPNKKENLRPFVRETQTNNKKEHCGGKKKKKSRRLRDHPKKIKFPKKKKKRWGGNPGWCCWGFGGTLGKFRQTNGKTVKKKHKGPPKKKKRKKTGKERKKKKNNVFQKFLSPWVGEKKNKKKKKKMGGKMPGEGKKVGVSNEPGPPTRDQPCGWWPQTGFKKTKTWGEKNRNQSRVPKETVGKRTVAVGVVGGCGAGSPKSHHKKKSGLDQTKRQTEFPKLGRWGGGEVGWAKKSSEQNLGWVLTKIPNPHQAKGLKQNQTQQGGPKGTKKRVKTTNLGVQTHFFFGLGKKNKAVGGNGDVHFTKKKNTKPHTHPFFFLLRKPKKHPPKGGGYKV